MSQFYFLLFFPSSGHTLLKKREFDEIKKGQEVELAILWVLNQGKVFGVDKCMQSTLQRGSP